MIENLSVVYRSIPTSNRNFLTYRYHGDVLYIVLFLHQTATILPFTTEVLRCISFYSYIKPQRDEVSCYSRRGCISFYSYIKPQRYEAQAVTELVVYRSIPTSNRNSALRVESTNFVVYRSIPTSNRNSRITGTVRITLYIVLFLHQTATITNMNANT